MRYKNDPLSKTKLMGMVDVFYRLGGDGLRRHYTRKDRAEAAIALRKVAIALDRTTDPPTFAPPRQKVTNILERLQEIEDSALGQECRRLGFVEFDAGPTEAQLFREAAGTRDA